MKKIILALCFIGVIFGSCSTTKHFKETKETTTVDRDSVTHRDTIYVYKTIIKRDTVYETITIPSDSIVDNKIKTFPPIFAHKANAHASAGITNNRLWLQLLIDQVVSKDTTFNNNRTITVKTITNKVTSEKIEKVKKTFFWNNTWFWFCIILILAFIIKIKGIF